MTPARLAEIEARLAAVAAEYAHVPGVFEWRRTPDEHIALFLDGEEQDSVFIAYAANDADVELVAHAPADLRDLLAEVRRLEVEEQALRDEMMWMGP